MGVDVSVLLAAATLPADPIVWLRSARETHTFVSPDDITAMVPQVRQYLNSTETEFWVVSADSDGSLTIRNK